MTATEQNATGVLVQPLPDTQKRHQPCRRGHYFVQIADRDHVFFESTPKETSAIVGELFKGFSGYVQADAKSVYDPVPPASRGPARRRLGRPRRAHRGWLSESRAQGSVGGDSRQERRRPRRARAPWPHLCPRAQVERSSARREEGSA